MIGAVRAALAAVLATAWYGGRILWATARGKGWDPNIFDEGPRDWALMILRWTGTKVRVENAGVIVPGRPQVLVLNHVSWFDVLAVLGHVPDRCRFVAKKELASVPVFGPALKAAGHICINRHDLPSAIRSMEVAREVLERDGPTMILFAEGTRSLTGELRPFKKGAFVLAIQTGAEVVPAAVLGTREIMRKGSLKVRTGRTITLRFGEAIPVGGLTLDNRDDLAHRTRSAVATLLAQGEPTAPGGASATDGEGPTGGNRS